MKKRKRKKSKRLWYFPTKGLPPRDSKGRFRKTRHTKKKRQKR